MEQSERRSYLIKELLQETPGYENIAIPQSAEEQKKLLRGLMNIRSPRKISDKFLSVQNAYLQEELFKKGITEPDSLSPIAEAIYLWQGDITTLRCDAIVNAANSGMTGCYVPNHQCIDNSIHSFSGIQLRNACADIMRKQGHAEATGKAKITEAYNLPCKHILHTVGPIITGALTSEDCEFLRSCYLSCLELASEKELSSIAFCCISTGEFHFPNEKAAEIAVHTVQQFLQQKTSLKKVVFNVFKDYDKEIYERLLTVNQ